MAKAKDNIFLSALILILSHWIIDMENRNFKSIFIKSIIFFFILGFFSVSLNAEEKNHNELAIETYKQNRQAFLSKQKDIDRQFEQNEQALKKELQEIENNIQKRKNELSKAHVKINQKQISIHIVRQFQSGMAYFFFPIATLALKGLSFLGDLKRADDLTLSIFLSLGVINLFLYLMIRQKAFFVKYKIALIILACVLVCGIATPLFADEENLTKQQRLEKNLKMVETVFSQTDDERYIAILESWTSNAPVQLDLTKLKSKDPLLPIFKIVRRDTPQYCFSLAALYMNQGRTGNAIDLIERFINMGDMKSNPLHDQLIINAIKFLIQQNQTELASQAVEKKAVNISAVSTLIQLAEFLEENGMNSSREKVLGYAVQKADTVKGLVELSTFLISHGENDIGTNALDQAINLAKSTDELLIVTEAAIKAEKNQVIDQVIRRTKYIPSLSQKLEVTDLFLKFNRKEEAISVFSEMIKNVRQSTPDKIDHLLFLIDAALSRDFIPQAVNATQRLFLYLGPQKNNFPMKMGLKLESAKGLPHKDKITLPQFYGMLNEELNYDKKAEEQYIDSINLLLIKILESYGYDLPDSLNDFYLLGRIWTERDQNQIIGQLDRVYTIIEEQFIQKQALAHENDLRKLQKEINLRKKEEQTLYEQISSLEKKWSELSREFVLRIISIIASMIFFVCIIVGALFLSYQHAKHLTQQKTFGFMTKFIEISGWVRVMTFLGAISGFLTILFAQFFQILQGVHENSFHSQQNIANDSSLIQYEP